MFTLYVYVGLYVYIVCVYMYMSVCVLAYACHGVHVVAREQFLELVLSFHYVDSKDQIQIIRLGDKLLYPLIPLRTPGITT